MTEIFRDPIHDGATDPVIVQGPTDGTWWLFYTSRRADAPAGQGVAWVHGSDIGVASSSDGGTTWLYRGVVAGLQHESGRNTFWAPEVIRAEGIYHMYVSYIRGVPDRWAGHERHLLHYTSPDLLTWTHHGDVLPGYPFVIDACVHPLPDGGYRMWFKNEADGSSTWATDSADLYRWGEPRPVLRTAGGHEGPNVFAFRGRFWMVVDSWDGQLAFVSEDLASWAPAGRVLDGSTGRPGTDDDGPGLHADVLVHGDDAYITYFTHPAADRRETWETRRSTIHVATLEVEGDALVCDRAAETRLSLL